MGSLDFTAKQIFLLYRKFLLCRSHYRCSSSSFPIPKDIVDTIKSFPIFPEKVDQGNNEHECTPFTLPSVTTILSVSAPPESQILLKKWRNKKIEELGVDGFGRYMTQVTCIGTKVHGTIEDYLMNKEELDYVSADIRGFFQSAKDYLSFVKSSFNGDKNVSHQQLLYRGILDNIVTVGNHQELLEIKTKYECRRVISFKDTYDDSLQLAAYIGAYNSNRHPDMQITRGRLLYLYKDGHPATDFFFKGHKLEEIWHLWKQRLVKYYRSKLESVTNDTSSAPT